MSRVFESYQRSTKTMHIFLTRYRVFPYPLKGAGKGGEDMFIEDDLLIYWPPGGWWIPPPDGGKGKGKDKGAANRDVVETVEVSDEASEEVVVVSDAESLTEM